MTITCMAVGSEATDAVEAGGAPPGVGARYGARHGARYGALGRASLAPPEQRGGLGAHQLVQMLELLVRAEVAQRRRELLLNSTVLTSARRLE